jgi:hypothetical protein
MLTKNFENSGTNSHIVLIVNQNGIDKVNDPYGNTSQDDQEKGQANVYGQYVEDDEISRENLNNSSFRIAIQGNDAWRPEHYFIWGYDKDDEVICPLAVEMDINTTLSTDYSEGVISLPIRSVAIGSNNMVIRRLAIFVVTRDTGNAGTNSPVNLQINSGGNLIFNYDFPDTPQKDLERGQANLYIAPVGIPFRKRDLDDQSLLLSIKGTDFWLPHSMTIFGLNQDSDRPTAMVTLSYKTWTFQGHMSTDPAEGDASVVLPLEPSPGIRVGPLTELGVVKARLQDYETRLSQVERQFRIRE